MAPGAWTDRRWTVPVAAMLALPVVWWTSLPMLLAIVPLERGAYAGSGRVWSSVRRLLPDRTAPRIVDQT